MSEKKIEWECRLPSVENIRFGDCGLGAITLADRAALASVEALRRIAEELYQMRTGKSEWIRVQDAPYQGKGVKGREFGVKAPGSESAV